MIKINYSNGKFEVEEIFKNLDIDSTFMPPLFVDGYLYFNSIIKGDKKGLVCIDSKGQEMWSSSRDLRYNHGASIYADGVIFQLNAQSGEICIVDANPKYFKLLDKAKFLKERYFWGTMALSRGKLLARDGAHLFCINVRKQ